MFLVPLGSKFALTYEDPNTHDTVHILVINEAMLRINGKFYMIADDKIPEKVFSYLAKMGVAQKAEVIYPK